MIILKAVLLLSAFTAIVLRLVAHKYGEAFGETAATMNIIAFVAMGICLVCALIWCVIIKKEEKALKASEAAEEAEEAEEAQSND